MLSNLLGKITIFAALFEIDLELADQHQRGGCRRCGGPLHQGGYIRKPRGELCEAPERYRRRHSFCCGDCRRRSMAPSLLFWERRVYWGAAFVLAAAARQQRPGLSYGYLRRLLGVSATTVRRWVTYFTKVFPTQARWTSRRGHVSAEVPNDQLPAALLENFNCHRSAEEGLVAALRFLSA